MTIFLDEKAKSLQELIKEVAKKEIMPRYLQVGHEYKQDGSLCTEADLAAQTFLLHHLSEVAPYPVLGEEMSEEQQQALWNDNNQQGLWCIDPIDGTSNFVNGVPYFAVSVALIQGGRSVLGAVYNPLSGEMFYAEKGAGAFLNNQPLPVKKWFPKLKDAMASIELKQVGTQLREQLACHAPFASERNFGASTLDWCYVAAGRFHVSLHGGQRLWDYAAGSLILEEAGGFMCTLKFDNFWDDHLWQRSVISALNPDLFKEWKEWVRSVQ